MPSQRKSIGPRRKAKDKNEQRAAGGTDGGDDKHGEGIVTRAARAQAAADRRAATAEKRAARNLRYAKKL